MKRALQSSARIRRRRPLRDLVICTPRFYKYIEDLELCGVGLSCEASVELLAKDNNNRELVFTIEDDDNEFSPDERLKLEMYFNY